ncbi:MAG: hypothetical protein ABFQ95_01130 [Pseudomonadota bacterium]
MPGGSIGPSSSSAASFEKTAFGELSVQHLHPQTVIHFPYNLNTDIVNTTVVDSRTVTYSDQFAVIASGAATTSSGMLQSRIQPDFISIASDGTKTADIHVYKNATVGGTPAFTDVSTNTSVVDYDIAGTTISSGALLTVVPVQKVGNASIPFHEFDVILSPGDTLTASATSSGASDVLIGISWKERFN